MIRGSLKKYSCILALGMVFTMHVQALSLNWVQHTFFGAIGSAISKVSHSPYTAQGMTLVSSNSGKFAVALAALTAAVGYVWGKRAKPRIAVEQENLRLRQEVAEFNSVADESKGIIGMLMERAATLKSELERVESLRAEESRDGDALCEGYAGQVDDLKRNLSQVAEKAQREQSVAAQRIEILNREAQDLQKALAYARQKEQEDEAVNTVLLERSVAFHALLEEREGQLAELQRAKKGHEELIWNLTVLQNKNTEEMRQLCEQHEKLSEDFATYEKRDIERNAENGELRLALGREQELCVSEEQYYRGKLEEMGAKNSVLEILLRREQKRTQIVREALTAKFKQSFEALKLERDGLFQENAGLRAIAQPVAQDVPVVLQRRHSLGGVSGLTIAN